ncbi:amino acid/polyamine/organocation transporter (APC superfamily) [Jatrophihabitans sp. GAS493]|uniref:APC family permease n=1 Tax=Jatrophihabitans sp. GAS493 TaxID=1907575 RepID=UPI000BB8E6CD|nr:APC family permease [Jatrophihabitans sp. GAS493]SOD74564.1 amino acid/polyamine/organocation transporter (APC superfamily) [Jatrophihabitans sp. GAS493]
MTDVQSTESPRGGGLQRTVGYYGLMFVSLGSIIGSGWLLSALTASETAGPASIISWMIAVVILTVLALVYAELGATYPVAGGTGRFPYFSHGPLAGFVAGWTSWLQAVMIAPIEILGAIAYANSLASVQKHFNMINETGSNKGLLNERGLVVAAIAMVIFTAMNLAGAKFMAESNAIVVIWKTAIPVLTIIVIASLSFHIGNFHAGGSFMPFGIHGVFAALPLGVVFALQGFEQAVQLAGEARDPKRDLSRAIITAMAIGGGIYILLQVVFIGAVNPADVADGWLNPLGGNAATDQGAWHTLALAVGATWLAAMIVIDGVVSPSGTGIVYVGTSARLSYALGEEREMPSALAQTNRRGVPVVSILLAFVVGVAAFGPFPSWNKLVNVVTGATAIMYAFAPVSLAALKKRDPHRHRTYQMPYSNVLTPAAFCSASLLLYWGGFQTMWKIDCAILVGLMLFGIGISVAGTDALSMLRPAAWLGPWLLGMTIIGSIGRYTGEHNGVSSHTHLAEWWDLVVVIGFSLLIFYWAVNSAMTQEKVIAAIERDKRQLDDPEQLTVSA